MTSIGSYVFYGDGLKNLTSVTLPDSVTYIGEGAVRFRMTASGKDEGTVEIRLDSPEGALLGSITCPPTGDWMNYQQFDTEIPKTEGIHDLCLLFKGDGEYVMNVDWLIFEKAADINQDGMLTIIDAAKILRLAAQSA